MSISVKNVTKIYGTQKALDNVSFEIGQGEIVGFLGPNGAGKSTMMKIITGYIPQTSGTVAVLGKDVNENPIFVKSHIGYLPEHNPLYLEMYVHEFLLFNARVLHVPDAKNRVAEIIGLVGLEREQNKKIGALSKGYRQRVGLAHALIHNPEVLILDEPTSGLDPNQILEIRDLIKTIGQTKTVMLSTHIMQEVEAICSRVIVINSGKIVADKPIDELQLNYDNITSIRIQFSEKIDIALFDAFDNIFEVNEKPDNIYEVHVQGGMDIRPEIFEAAVKANLTVLELTLIERDMEDIFHALTRKKK